MTNLKGYITEVPDFPKDGVLFYDVTPLFKNKFNDTLEKLEKLFTQEEWLQVDCIAGVESRGFTLAAGLAARLGKNFTHIRKAGKLPGRVAKRSYGLEYGNDALEMQQGSETIVIIDDVLATGGTLEAAAELAHETGHNVLGLGVLINLPALNDFKWNNQTARTVLTYE